MPWPADEIAKEARAVEVTRKQAVRAKRLGDRAKCDARRWPCVVRTSRGQCLTIQGYLRMIQA